MKRILFTLPLAIFVMAAALACSSGPTTKYGDSADHGNGTIRTYITTGTADDGTAMPLAVGVEMTSSAFEGLPSEGGHGDVESETILDIPESNVSTPISWMMLNWNPQGHVPPGVYDVPHHDFHFYMMEQAKLDEIKSGSCPDGGEGVDCETFQRGQIPLPAEYAAPDYVDVGAVVPRMGNHLIDLTSAEFTGTKFNHTFIYGFFDGEVTFYEPMITREFLQGKPEDQCVDIKQPQAFAKPGWYPTQYCMKYHKDTDKYTVSLENFVSR